MKYIFLNLKRFDAPREIGGVNGKYPLNSYAKNIIENTADGLKGFKNCVFAAFLPELHLLPAVKAKQNTNSPIAIGCQSVFYDDVAKGGNFGAFTSNRPAKVMANAGVFATIIGHCEERRDIAFVSTMCGGTDNTGVDKILNKKVKAAVDAGLHVLFCIGESLEQQPNKYEVLKNQLERGLEGVDLTNVVIAYEPIWAIGPGKTPPDREYIQDIAKFIKSVFNLAVVYGGGLKVDNAKMLASIDEIDGGLIALTRFSGEIGFYEEEYLEIISTYLN